MNSRIIHIKLNTHEAMIRIECVALTPSDPATQPSARYATPESPAR
jgi:hypothetical protein